MVDFSEATFSSLIWILITVIWFLHPGLPASISAWTGELFGFRQVYPALMKTQSG